MRPSLLAPILAALLACKPEAPRALDAQVPSALPSASASSASNTVASATEAPPPPPPPATAASAGPPYDTTCHTDDDCAPAPSCCPAPCTSLVVNVKELPRIQAALSSCDRSLPCPSAGGCRTHAYLCTAGRCGLVFAGDPGYRERR